MTVFLAVPLLVLDLGTSDGGLVGGGFTGQWAWGEPATGPVGLGHCWMTNLDGDYLHDTVDTLEVPLPDLGSATRPVLLLTHWFDIAAGDRGVVEIDAGAGFVVADPIRGYPEPSGFTGSSGAYVEDAFDLGGLPPGARLRLVLEADPAVAGPGWAVQGIGIWDGDVLAPEVLAVTVPTDTQDLDGPYEVVVEVSDDVGVAAVDLSWSIGGGTAVTEPMQPLGGGLYRGQIPGQPPDTLVEWSVAADDGGQVGRWPSAGLEAFRVFLAAPTELRGPTGSRVVAQQFPLTWTPPVSPHPVVGYQVLQEGQEEARVVAGAAASVALTPSDSQRFTVRAIYDVGIGDASEVLELDVEIPGLAAVEPVEGFQGERLYVSIRGRSLYLLQGESGLGLGAGVTVLDLDVRDANAATALVEIAPGAAIGAVDAVLDGTRGTFRFEDAFRIRAGDEAPRVVSITPASLRQGDEVEVEVRASQPFAGPVSVDGDEDLFLTRSVDTVGDAARFGLAASTRSRIGAHTLVLDDGERLWAVDIDVDEYVATLDRGCATAPTSGAPWLLLALLVSARPSRPTGPAGGRRGRSPVGTGRSGSGS